MISQFNSVFNRTKPYSTLDDDKQETRDEVLMTNTARGVTGELRIDTQEYDKADSNDDSTTSDQLWNSTSMVSNVSSVASNATLSTNKYFGLSSHVGKGGKDVTIDAFIGIEGKTGNNSTGESLAATRKPYSLPKRYNKILETALSCITERDYNKFVNLITENPSILLCQCQKHEDKGNAAEKRLRGLYGGTILHVLVSQKPKLKKKKSTKLHMERAKISSKMNSSYEIHVMPSVPESVLRYVIKLHPEALSMIDDFGRLPLHCATLSLSNHLEEMAKIYGIPDIPDSGNCDYTISRFVVKEMNLVPLLLEFSRGSASICDKRKNLALHYAAMMPPDYKGMDLATYSIPQKSGPPCAEYTVKVLIDSYPEGMGKENKNGQIPLHLLCSKGIKMNLASLQTFLQYHVKWRDVPSEKDANGDTPLHLVIKSRATHRSIQTFASCDDGREMGRLFRQRDGNNNNALHVALNLKQPPPDKIVLSTIISIAPFTAGWPNDKGIMPIKQATKLQVSDDLICEMLRRDMPIEIGTLTKLSCKSGSGFARHIVERSHHNSWWYIIVECKDKYVEMVRQFLSENATHSQIVTLARQVGPDGKSVVINCVSDKCKLMFHSLLRFYDRYEILLSSGEKTSRGNDGIQSFHALDYGPISANDYVKKKASAAVKVKENKEDTSVEVSLLSKEKSKVLLRCYHYEEAFFAEIKIRERCNFSTEHVEEIYNHHHDTTYTHLTLSKAEKLCCITFERPDHTLDTVFQSISPGTRSQKWVEKCWVVLRQIASALKELHDNDLIHGHLEPSNVAKFGNNWKLSNVGTVIPFGSPVRGLARSCAPPESIFKSPYANKSPTRRISPKQRQLKFHKVKFSSKVEVEEIEANVRNIGGSPRRKIRGTRKSSSSTLKPLSDNDSSNSSNGYFFNFKAWGTNTGAGAEDHNVDGVVDSREDEACSEREGRVLWEFTPEKCIASPAWDMWGFGLIMVQLLLGRCTILPNFEKANDAILRNLYEYDKETLKKIVGEVDKAVGKDAADLISKLLQSNPNNRPKSLDEVLKHDYFETLTIYV